MPRAEEAIMNIDLSPDEISTVISALIDKRMESRRYAANSRVDAPQDTDLCCDAHRARYERNKVVSDAMNERVAVETALIERFDLLMVQALEAK